MKTAKRILFGAMSAIVMVGCSDDKLGQDGPNNPVPDNEDGVFMTVNIKMPSSETSRSYTDPANSSNSGTEIGQDYENNVNTVYLVLARHTDNPATNNAFIAWGEIPGNKILKDNNGQTYNTTAKFSKTDIAQYYQTVTDDASREVNVFVFCNPTLNMRDALTQAEKDKTNSWVNTIATYEATDPTAEIIWSENDFLMTNASIATRTFPKTLEDWNAYTVESNPFDLSGDNKEVNIDNLTNRGAVHVERAAARFDFRDASPNFTGKDASNLYQVIFDEWTNSDGGSEKDSYINIKLTKMSFVNMAKNFYYLRRVTEQATAADATPSLTNTILCGDELPWFTNQNGTLVEDRLGNYVVGPYAQEMLSPITTNFSNYYNYPCFDSAGNIDDDVFNNWFTSVIDDILGGKEDNPENWAGADTQRPYYIWRYSTENSIPSIDMQKNGQTTGVVFKGKLIATPFAAGNDDENLRELSRIINNTDKSLTGDSNNDPTLYLFAGRLYATWANVAQAAKEAAIVPVWEADNSITAGGYWRLEINRGNTLFHAVFGEGGCGSYTFKDSAGEEYTVDDPVGPDKSSPNYLWEAWNNDDSEGQGKRPGNNAATTIAFKNAATANNFTLYQSSIDTTDGVGYYCYYYYWNRHNDNGQNGVMGPMEFCVIRNNVYKLSVSAINQLGHPRHSINDPKPPTPDTDDEVDDVYITVQVDVLPWVVRVNDIHF